jgi:hypothetical protein
VPIQQQYLARWDGKLPQYAFGGNAMPFVQIPARAASPLAKIHSWLTGRARSKIIGRPIKYEEAV